MWHWREASRFIIVVLDDLAYKEFFVEGECDDASSFAGALDVTLVNVLYIVDPPLICVLSVVPRRVPKSG